MMIRHARTGAESVRGIRGLAARMVICNSGKLSDRTFLFSYYIISLSSKLLPIEFRHLVIGVIFEYVR